MSAVSRAEWSAVKFKARRIPALKFKAKYQIAHNIDPIMDRLEELSKAGVSRVVTKALKAQMKLVETEERNMTRRNSTYPQSARSKRMGHRSVAQAMALTVGSKVKKQSKTEMTAKAGFSVGRKANSQRKSKEGVGISSNNAHWFGLGTDERSTGSRKSGNTRKATGKKVQRAGRLVPLEPSFRSLSNSTRQIDTLTRNEMEREVQQLAK